jgi:regulator of cell morphogenesis and NO signaling
MTAFSINQVLVRYQSPLPTSLQEPSEIWKSFNIDQQFISALIETFEHDASFSADKFKSFQLPVILDYIKRTHQYYITKKLPEIEQSIHLLLQDYDGQHPLLPILLHFYRSYSSELKSHIETEERKLLPYIEALVKANHLNAPELTIVLNYLKTYSLNQFLEDHDDTEQDLSKIREIIKAYQPPKTNQSPYRILLSQLEVFEKDLHIHAMIEEEVLLPKAAELESQIRINLNAQFS